MDRSLLSDVRDLILSNRRQVAQTINAGLSMLYWGIGQRIRQDILKVWKTVQQTVELGSGQAYDEACRTIVDLSKVYALHASRKRFQEVLRKFMAGHLRCKALIQGLLKAGIWKDK
jgi:hypothetical protein